MGGMHRFGRIVGPFLCSGVLLVACVNTVDKKFEKFTRSTEGLRILQMPIDIELSELNAGGLEEPKADWTATGRKHFMAGIKKIMAERKARLIPYNEPSQDSASARDQMQLIKLHGVVGATILLRSAGIVLPTKQDKFDWTLGPDVRALGERNKADYALFVFVRDSYATGGRVAVMMVTALLFGVAVQGGRQIGFASVVDLKTGNIVWFNRLLRGAGDLRNEEDAMETVKTLLADLPK